MGIRKSDAYKQKYGLCAMMDRFVRVINRGTKESTTTHQTDLQKPYLSQARPHGTGSW